VQIILLERITYCGRWRIVVLRPTVIFVGAQPLYPARVLWAIAELVEASTVDVPQCEIAAGRPHNDCNHRCTVRVRPGAFAIARAIKKTGADTGLHRLFAPHLPDHTAISVWGVRSLACPATPAEEGQRGGEHCRQGRVETTFSADCTATAATPNIVELEGADVRRVFARIATLVFGDVRIPRARAQSRTTGKQGMGLCGPVIVL
jgi:hypothetical protein